MGKYKRLLSNTAILGAGTFASKVLVFLLMPFYTGILSSADFGTADLIAQTANLLIPLAAVGICDGIFRFTLDSADEPQKALSTGVVILAVGSTALCVFIQFFRLFHVFDGYILLIAFYVIAANFHSAFAGYIRARGRTTLFAVQGIINTVLTIVLNVLFLAVFEWGSTGYVLSVVVADSVMTVFLFFIAKIYRDISPKYVSRSLAKEMLRFSIPYIPTTMLWLITSVSDRYIVTAYCGESVNGLYTAAYKLPTLLSLVSGIFVEAWHFSTIKDANEEEKSSFFSQVYVNFMSVMFMGASFLIAGAKLFTNILLANSYYSSWEYVPILVIATTFSTLVSFLGSVYFLRKKSMLSMFTALSGAVINIILNFVMIPEHGAMGAAVATLISYLAVYIIRSYDTAKYLKFSLHPIRVTINALALFLQAAIMMGEIPYWQFLQAGMLVFVLIFNGKGIALTVFRLLGHFFQKKTKKI